MRLTPTSIGLHTKLVGVSVILQATPLLSFFLSQTLTTSAACCPIQSRLHVRTARLHLKRPLFVLWGMTTTKNTNKAKLRERALSADFHTRIVPIIASWF